MLTISGVTCARGDKTLFENLDFSLEQGELAYLRGPNGTGKTTLLRTICGMVQPVNGQILWNGTDIHELDEEFRQHLLYIGHANALKDTLSGLENMRFMARMARQSPSDDEISDSFARLGVEVCQELPVRVLSQGQKRRIALARLGLSKAMLWVLDEPFVALDVKAVETLSQLIGQHVADGGMVMLTTHQEVPLTRGNVKTITLGT